MQTLNRPILNDIEALAPYETTLDKYCQECADNKREWNSTGKIYRLLRNELSKLSQGHCSFCDGYPFSMSKETIEHYFPKAEYKNKTYQWDNLFLCCDKCQSNSNKDKPFRYTIKFDVADYYFEALFWFDAIDGKVKVLENIELPKQEKANGFLKRYGINDCLEVLKARQKYYQDLIIIMQNDPNRLRDLEPNRFIFDTVKEFLSYKNQ